MKAFTNRFLRTPLGGWREGAVRRLEQVHSLLEPPVLGPTSPRKIPITTSCSQVTGKESGEQKRTGCHLIPEAFHFRPWPKTEQEFVGRIDIFLPTQGNQNVFKFTYVDSHSWAHGRDISMGVSCGSRRHSRLEWNSPGPLPTSQQAPQSDASISCSVVSHFPPGGECRGWTALG